MVIAALFILVKKWKKSKSPSTDEWINKISISTSFSGINKTNEIRIDAITWTNLENTVLSERSKSQKDKHCLIPLTRNAYYRQIQRDRKENRHSQGQP